MVEVSDLDVHLIEVDTVSVKVWVVFAVFVQVISEENAGTVRTVTKDGRDQICEELGLGDTVVAPVIGRLQLDEFLEDDEVDLRELQRPVVSISMKGIVSADDLVSDLEEVSFTDYIIRCQTFLDSSVKPTFPGNLLESVPADQDELSVFSVTIVCQIYGQIGGLAGSPAGHDHEYIRFSGLCPEIQNVEIIPGPFCRFICFLNLRCFCDLPDLVLLGGSFARHCSALLTLLHIFF